MCLHVAFDYRRGSYEDSFESIRPVSFTSIHQVSPILLKVNGFVTSFLTGPAGTEAISLELGSVRKVLRAFDQRTARPTKHPFA